MYVFEFEYENFKGTYNSIFNKLIYMRTVKQGRIYVYNAEFADTIIVHEKNNDMNDYVIQR